MGPYWIVVGTLWKREFVRFFRQRNRVVGAIGPPVLIWVFIGSGFGSSFQAPSSDGMSYLEYFYPGMIVLVVLFTSIFSAISVIEDRRDGFLQGVLVTPAPRSAIVLGKILGGASQACVQGCLLLVICPFLGIELTAGRAAYVLVTLAIVSFSLTAFGFMMAWRTDSSQGYHAVMNLLLMPMWLLSGAFFPLTSSPTWIRLVMRVNPLTYGVSALRGSMYHGDAVPALVGSAGHMPVFVIMAFGVGMFAIAAVVVNRPARTA
jgi:ABC-2 type transport system permease protein